jgi:transposase
VQKRASGSIVAPYGRLIAEWYRQYPSLKAIQILERLRSHGFTGGYTSVKLFTRPFRQKPKQAYHELVFLPGEEAQVDWMQWRFPFGTGYGFVWILSYSRYLYARFYPGQSMEFFLAGHLEAFREVGGVAHRGRYDNLKSVVIRRQPQTVFNSQFMDFARHFGFSVYLCTPGRANEKGRVERVIRDMEGFLMTHAFSDLEDLNRQFARWRAERNGRLHRSTGKAPAVLLAEEKLKPLPALPYRPYRLQTAAIGSTGFVQLQTNRYSAPSSCANRLCSLLIYPDQIEIVVDGKKCAAHRRSFARNQTIEHPAHREKLLRCTPAFKRERILQLMSRMDKAIEAFIQKAGAEGEDPAEVACELFRLLKGRARESLVSAVREASALGIYKSVYIANLLEPSARQPNPVYPQDPKLLGITYEGRKLENYDELL